MDRTIEKYSAQWVFGALCYKTGMEWDGVRKVVPLKFRRYSVLTNRTPELLISWFAWSRSAEASQFCCFTLARSRPHDPGRAHSWGGPCSSPEGLAAPQDLDQVQRQDCDHHHPLHRGGQRGRQGGFHERWEVVGRGISFLSHDPALPLFPRVCLPHPLCLWPIQKGGQRVSFQSLKYIQEENMGRITPRYPISPIKGKVMPSNALAYQCYNRYPGVWAAIPSLNPHLQHWSCGRYPWQTAEEQRLLLYWQWWGNMLAELCPLPNLMPEKIFVVKEFFKSFAQGSSQSTATSLWRRVGWENAARASPIFTLCLSRICWNLGDFIIFCSSFIIHR